MYNHPMRPVRALALPIFPVGLIVTLALLFAACGSPTSSINAPSSNDPSAVALKPASKPAMSRLANTVPSAALSNFALLGNAAVTATDATITGDVGTFEAPPTGAVTLTASPLDGTVHIGDAVAVQAYNDFLSAYAAIMPDPGDILLTGTLAGETLAPGSYYFPAAATLTGTLTLDAQGDANAVWIFKIGTVNPGALTGTGFQVVMANGGQACNVTWWVDAAVTMTGSDFQGNILAGAAITMTGGTLTGNAWSQAGVTITGPATVVGCECSNGNGNGNGDGHGHGKDKCNQGVGNGPEGCDPGNSNHNHSSNDEGGGTPGNPGRKGGGK